MEVENMPVDNLDCVGGDVDGGGGTDDTGNHTNGNENDKSATIKKPSPPGSDALSKRRGSRKISRQNSREGVGHVNGGLNSFIAPQRRWKNSRRSRNGYGRGLPKVRNENQFSSFIRTT